MINDGFSTARDAQWAREVSHLVSVRLTRRMAVIARRHSTNPDEPVGMPHCTECGHQWPCWTWRTAMGDLSDDQ